jgi:hypothetical protein
MKRKTTSEGLAGDSPDEIHDWLWTANIKELREFLRRVKREEHWGSHARDADVGVYSLHLKSNRITHGNKEIETTKNIRKREVSIQQLLVISTT